MDVQAAHLQRHLSEGNDVLSHLCCASPEAWEALRVGPCKRFSCRTDSHVTETGLCQYWGLKLWKCVSGNVGWSVLVDRNDFFSVSQWRVSFKKENESIK